jgi:hypothetical protein
MLSFLLDVYFGVVGSCLILFTRATPFYIPIANVLGFPLPHTLIKAYFQSFGFLAILLGVRLSFDLCFPND